MTLQAKCHHLTKSKLKLKRQPHSPQLQPRVNNNNKMDKTSILRTLRTQKNEKNNNKKLETEFRLKTQETEKNYISKIWKAKTTS